MSAHGAAERFERSACSFKHTISLLVSCLVKKETSRMANVEINDFITPFKHSLRFNFTLPFSRSYYH